VTRWLRAATLCVTFMACEAAQAAEINVHEGAASEPALVSISGQVNKGDDETFREKVRDLRSAIVFMAGPGGLLTAAISIGLTIRKKGFETAIIDGATCVSACALAWLGGSPRRMGEGASIGFHRPRNRKTKEPTARGDALVEAYANELKLPHAALTLLISADRGSMTWMTETQASAYGVHYSELRQDQVERYKARYPAWSSQPGNESTRFVAVIASKRSRVDALNAIADLQQKYADVLASRTVDVQEVNLGERGIWYRAAVGPPVSREAATTVCSQLKSAGHALCWVVAR
jgi:ATP-dependent protease ClpP protease subunit